MLFDELRDFTLSVAGIDTLDHEQLSQGDLMDLDLEDIVKVSLVVEIVVLVLDADLSVVVELAREEQVVRRFNLQVVATSKGVNQSVLSILVLDYSSLLLSQRNHIDSIL